MPARVDEHPNGDAREEQDPGTKTPAPPDRVGDVVKTQCSSSDSRSPGEAVRYEADRSACVPRCGSASMPVSGYYCA